MSRQTIGKYRHKLEDLGLIASVGDYVYYRVYKEFGVQEHEIITQEEYSKAWKSYWQYRSAHPDADSAPAYRHMYNEFGGVPRKQRRVERNGINARQINTLLDLASKSILEEIDG